MGPIETEAHRNVEAEERRFEQQRAIEDGDPGAIEREIDATRADMRATLEALERRFSVERLMDLALGRIRDRGGRFAGNLTETAAENPMPVVLTAIGLGWMMLASRRGGYDGVASDMSSDTMDHGRGRMAGATDAVRGAADTMRGAADSVRNAAHSTRDTLQHAADSSREAFRSAAHSSRERFEHTAQSLRSAAASTHEYVDYARARMDRLLDEQPLMLGAFGLAAGAIIGALLPTTEHENRLLGETRDKAVKDIARNSRARFEAAASTIASPPGGGAESASEERPASRPH